MKVTITSTTPSKQGLHLGLRIEHEKAGWVRFATTVLVAGSLNYRERQMILDWLEDARTPLETELDTPFTLYEERDGTLEPRHW